MQPVQLLSNAQLQRMLFISSKKEYEEIGRQLIRCFKKRKLLDDIQAISTANIFCRFGAVHEEHVGVGDTPGFERSTSINNSRGTWFYKASCISESKEYQMNGTDISVSNAGMEGKYGYQAIFIPIGSFES
jgi:hypothetical protein